VEENGVFRERHAGLFGVLLVVEAEAADGFHVFAGEGSEEESNILAISVISNGFQEYMLTAICSVTSCLPKISPLITRACLVFARSLTPCGRMASP